MNQRKSKLPPCVPVCLESPPQAPESTNLKLKYVIPKTNQSLQINYTEYLMQRKYKLFSGDRLVYQCQNDSFGVYGGPDFIHDAFRYILNGLII